MRNRGLMARIGQFLDTAGLTSVVPAPDAPASGKSAEYVNQMKRRAARHHMHHIQHNDTAAVLVINVNRPNIRDYIGPNTFAEIGVAFAASRRVFLLQGIPNAYVDELTAWGVTCLDRDVRPLLDALSPTSDIDLSGWECALHDARALSIDNAIAAEI
jgi:hypothetical protein